MRESRVVFAGRKSEIRVREGPRTAPPLALGGWGGEGYFASMKAAYSVFVRVDSPTVHPFFSSDRQAVSSVLRDTLVSRCTTRATTIQVFDRHCLPPVARHGAGRNVRFRPYSALRTAFLSLRVSCSSNPPRMSASTSVSRNSIMRQRNPRRRRSRCSRMRSAAGMRALLVIVAFQIAIWRCADIC